MKDLSQEQSHHHLCPDTPTWVQVSYTEGRQLDRRAFINTLKLNCHRPPQCGSERRKRWRWCHSYGWEWGQSIVFVLWCDFSFIHTFTPSIWIAWGPSSVECSVPSSDITVDKCFLTFLKCLQERIAAAIIFIID